MIVAFIHMRKTRYEPALESLPGLFDGGSQPQKMEAQAPLMISTFRGLIFKKKHISYRSIQFLLMLMYS